MKDGSPWPPSPITVLIWLAGTNLAQVFAVLACMLSKLRTSKPKIELLLIYLYKY